MTERVQRIALGLYAAEVAPGATYVVSHNLREPCVLRELWIKDPLNWSVHGLRFETRWLELDDPIVAEHIAYYGIDAHVAPAGFSLYLTVCNVTSEPHTIQAIVWAERV